jgi:hypothetical protein
VEYLLRQAVRDRKGMAATERDGSGTAVDYAEKTKVNRPD